MDATTQQIHDLMQQYFKPTEGNFLCEYIEEVKSAGGVLLPVPTKSMGHPIVAVSEGLNQKVGEWVVFNSHFSAQVFEAFGRKWFFARPFDTYCVVDMKYLKAQEDYFEMIKSSNTQKMLAN